MFPLLTYFLSNTLNNCDQVDQRSKPVGVLQPSPDVTDPRVDPSARFPHLGQKALPAGRALPQAGHTFALAAVLFPQKGQNTAEPSSFLPQ